MNSVAFSPDGQLLASGSSDNSVALWDVRRGKGERLLGHGGPLMGAMGAVFSVPYARLEAWPKSLETVRDAGFELLALTPAEQAKSLDEVAPHRMDRVALMLGAEGDGLSTKALMAADEWVRIPMAHGVDSLNVGAAAAVAFYAVATGRPEL